METVKKVDLTGYKEAMVFYGGGTTLSNVGLAFASFAYAKQLLMCVGKNIEPDCLDVEKIKKMFVDEKTFEHLHSMFVAGWTNIERKALIDLMHKELCNYIALEDLDYEPCDLNMWWEEMCAKTITAAKEAGYEDTYTCLNCLTVDGQLDDLWWDDTDVFKCTGYLWLAKEAAIHYGFVGCKKKYSDTFLEWCERNFITNKEEELERLHSLFKVQDNNEIDDILKKNMDFY